MLPLGAQGSPRGGHDFNHGGRRTFRHIHRIDFVVVPGERKSVNDHHPSLLPAVIILIPRSMPKKHAPKSHPLSLSTLEKSIELNRNMGRALLLMLLPALVATAQ